MSTILNKKPKSDKVATKKKNKQTTIFLPKINKVFLSPILRESPFWTKIFENDPLDEPKQMPSRTNLYLFRKMVENAKW